MPKTIAGHEFDKPGLSARCLHTKHDRETQCAMTREMLFTVTEDMIDKEVGKDVPQFACFGRLNRLEFAEIQVEKEHYEKWSEAMMDAVRALSGRSG